MIITLVQQPHYRHSHKWPRPLSARLLEALAFVSRPVREPEKQNHGATADRNLETYTGVYDMSGQTTHPIPENQDIYFGCVAEVP